MSDITKKVGKHVPSPYRTQNFTSADGSTGDVFLITESLGRPARNVTIRCEDGDMRIRFNVYNYLFPTIPDREGFMNVSHLPYLVSGVRHKDDSTAFVDIEAGSTFQWEADFGVSDIEVLTNSGHFDILVS